MKKVIYMILAWVLIVLQTTVFAQQTTLPTSDEKYRELSYTDGGREILPRQIICGDTVQISYSIPQKNGNIFCGWSMEGQKELLKPGQQAEITESVQLNAVWENGNLAQPKLQAVSDKDGSVTFSLDFAYGGPMNYASYTVHTRNLTTAAENTFEITGGKITVDSLPEGQYKAYLSAKKYNIEYLSDTVNFVVLSGTTGTGDALKLVMNGKELIFSDEQPQLIGSYTYIAVRHFCESMDARVVWRNEDRSSTITLGGTIIRLFENSDECIVNGTVQKLPVKTIIKNGRMLLPLRSVAEFCNAEIVWDDNRTVYIYSGSKNVFEENMMYIRTEGGQYLAAVDGELILKNSADPDCGWIFSAVDARSGIYTIYSLSDLDKPLQIKDSLAADGQPVAAESPKGFDGHLWRLATNSDGTYTISPANSSGIYFDAETLCLTQDAVSFDINYVDNLEF